MRNLIIILYMFFANTTLAQHDPIKEILREHFKKTEKIECKYRQEKKVAMIKDLLVSTGTFTYQKDKDIIWKQESPFQQTYTFSKKAKSTTERYINQFIISILNGEILNDQKLHVSCSEDEAQYILLVTPKQTFMHNKINEIKLKFKKQSVKLNRLEIVLNDNDITKIDFYE